MKNIYLPKEFKKYFWDVNFNKLSLKEHPSFILGRLMCLGNLKVLKWLLKFPKNSILKIVKSNREIDVKTQNFWLTLYAR